MEIKKREYFLRGSLRYKTITDEELYTLRVPLEVLDKYFYSYYKTREDAYRSIGLGVPNAYQRYWIYQRYRGGSVVTIGPVGIGKTTFSLIEALLCRGKAIFIVPTKALATTVYEKILSMNETLNTGKTILLYDKKTKESIISGDFHIAVMTAQAFRVIYPEIKWRSRLSIVDDVDAFMKNPKNLDRLMNVTRGSMILSSATFKASPRQRQRLREEFGISFRSSRFVGFRNVEDIYSIYETRDQMLDDVVRFIQVMGKGGIVFLPRGADEGELLETLQRAGIRADVGSPETLEDLSEGKLDVLVGKAAFYGVLVRGIDMPDVIRYTVFVGVPRGEIVLKPDADISKWWSTFIGGPVPSDWQEIMKKVKEVADRKAWSVSEEENGIRIIYPDITTYIQASGRTSRFTGSGFTFGVSFVADTDEKLMLAFMRRASLYGITFQHKDEVDIEALREKVDLSREHKEKEGQIPFRSYLMLVESPHKVETIASLLGGGVFRYIETSGGFIVRVAEVSFGTMLIVIGATIGHTSDIVEVSPRRWPHQVFYGVSIEDSGFYPIMDTIKMFDGGQAVSLVPDGIEYRDKLDIIRVYRNLALAVDGLLIATDPDSEGERIAYEVGAYLAPYGKSVYRMEFREITRKALLQALEDIRQIDTRRVEAALVRRIEDRWVGFFLSERVSKYFGRKGLSAGRVQSPVLGWIIERYQLSRQQKDVYRVAFPFIEDFYIEIEDKPDDIVTVESASVEVREKSPLPPYSTDLLLSDASRILGFSASYTMDLAQALFEGGFITYHRTDSTRVSEDGIKVAKMYITEKYGEELFHGKYWDIQTSEHMQGAHECIRPTRPIDVMEFWDVVRGRDEYTKDHGRLYGLIFRRFMASQSVNALLKYLTVLLKGFDNIEVPMEVEKEGYLVFFKDIKIYSLRYVPEVGSQVSLNVEVVKKPLAWPMREEEVIRQMKEKGIGRPSTYGKILETIKKRGYVRVSPKGYLIPTKIGIQVYDYLNREFHEFISPDRTALLYKKMDGVEDGEYEYMELLKEVYDEVNAYL